MNDCFFSNSRKYNSYRLLTFYKMSRLIYFYLLFSIVQSEDCLCYERVAGNLRNPLGLSPLNSTHLLIAEHHGLVRIVRINDGFSKVILDLRGKVVYKGAADEMGLLGMAVNRTATGKKSFLFLSYSSPNRSIIEDHVTRIVRYNFTNEGDIKISKPGELVLEISQPTPKHNGGHLFFDKDEALYICVGDGGGDKNIKFLKNSTLGKILRIRDFGDPAEIFASGFENPWRCSFDNCHDRIYCGDVGAGMSEEEIIQVERSGVYGWQHHHPKSPCTNMTMQRCSQIPSTDIPPPFKFPIHSFKTKQNSVVIGGVFYCGQQLPSLTNHYLFGELFSGSLHALQQQDNGKWKEKNVKVCPKCQLQHHILAFGEDDEKNIYVMSAKGFTESSEGIIYRLTNSGQTPRFLTQPTVLLYFTILQGIKFISYY